MIRKKRRSGFVNNIFFRVNIAKVLVSCTAYVAASYMTTSVHLHEVKGTGIILTLKGPKHEIFVADIFFTIEACVGR